MRYLLTPTILISIVVTGLAASEDWPSFRGPDSGGILPDHPGGINDDVSKGKLLWTSEEKHLPVGWGYTVGPSNKNRCRARSGGYAGPVVARGKVLFHYYLPSGDKVVTSIVEAAKDNPGKDQRPESWTVDADDVVLCLDAETGKTLWKTAVPGSAISWNLIRATPYIHPIVVGDRVYVRGCGGEAFCLELTTGEIVWRKGVGPGYAAWTKAREQLRAGPVMPSGKTVPWISHSDSGSMSPFLTSAAMIGGTLVYEDGYRDGKEPCFGLVGVDPANGELKWRVPAAVRSGASPQRWVVDGRELVLATATDGFRCIEPGSGEVLWSFAEDCMAGKSTPAISGNWLLSQGKPPPHGPKGHAQAKACTENPDPNMRGLAGYKVTPEGCERLWALPWPQRHACLSPPAIVGDRGYALVKGGLICVEMATGEIVATTMGAPSYMPLLVADGRIIAGTTIFPLDPAKWDAIVKRPPQVRVSRETFTPTAYAGGRLYVRGRVEGWSKTEGAPEPGCLYCVDLRK